MIHLAPAVLSGMWKCRNPECPLGDAPHDVLITGSVVEVSMLLQGWGFGPETADFTDAQKDGTIVFKDDRGSYLVLRPAMAAGELVASSATPFGGGGFPPGLMGDGGPGPFDGPFPF